MSQSSNAPVESTDLHQRSKGADKPTGLETFAVILCFLLAIGAVALQLHTGLHFLKRSWDDGSITAAFARTWAHSGRFAITPVSQTVEGFSSLLWFFFLSVPYFFSSTNDAGLVWMKVLAAIFITLSLPLMYTVALRQFKDRAAAITAVLLLAFCVTSLQEVEDGMEMNLAAFLLLLLFHVLTRETERGRVVYASLIGALLLLARFEMPFMLALLAAGLLLANSRRSPKAVSLLEILKIASFLALFFLAVELWRHHVFHVWMPNTIYAKRLPPYRDWSTLAKFFATRREAMDEPLHALRLPVVITLLAGLWAILRGRASWRSAGALNPAILCLALGCFLFGAVFGRNTGYPGRMVAPMVPFLILALVGICVSVVRDRRMLLAVFGLILAAHAFMWYRHDVRAPWIDTDIVEVEPIGLGADLVRVALHRDRLEILMSDVGGSSLCCDRLSVIDSGFLADATLSHTGFAQFEPYFLRTKPEIVESHFGWAIQEHIYDHHLLDGYSIVASYGIRFFLRDDLYRQLAAAQPQSVVPVGQVPACLGWYPNDIQFSLEKGTCLVLNHPEMQLNLDSQKEK